jgi:hypothetical protein
MKRENGQQIRLLEWSAQFTRKAWHNHQQNVKHITHLKPVVQRDGLALCVIKFNPLFLVRVFLHVRLFQNLKKGNSC